MDSPQPWSPLGNDGTRAQDADGHLRSVFVSDLHLGSPRARADALVPFLQGLEARFVFLVGDVVDHWSDAGTQDWPAAHLQVLEEVDRLIERGIQVHYLPGNHDGGFRRAWHARQPRLTIARRFEHRTADGRRLLVVHGDRFDPLIHRYRRLGHAADRLTAGLDALTGKTRERAATRNASRRGEGLKQRLKRWSGYTGRFERTALRHARECGFDGIVCGHAHAPALRREGGLIYANDGDWVQSMSALVEHPRGDLQLVFPAEGRASDPIRARTPVASVSRSGPPVSLERA